MTMNELLTEYLDMMKLLNKSKSSIVKTELYIKRFIDHMKEQNVNEVYDVRMKHIIDFQKYRKHIKNERYRRHDGINTQNRHIMCLKGFFSYLKKEGTIIHDPSKDVDYIKEPQLLPKPALSYQDFKKLVSKIDIQTVIGYRDRTIIELFYSSALRRNELRQLKINHLDYDNGYVRVIGKGNKERVVPIGTIACDYLETYMKGIRHYLSSGKQNDYVFLSQRGNQISETVIQRFIHKYAKAAKIKQIVTAHTLRRSAATGMIRNKANVMLVRDMLGHDCMEAINRYVDLTIVDLKDAHKKTHPREKKV